MNIFIETVENFSGGYLSYLRGLLSSSSFLNNVNITINCTRKMSYLLGNNHKNVFTIFDENVNKSVISKRYFQKKKLPKIIKEKEIDLIFNSSSTMNFFPKNKIPIVTTCLNVHPFSPEEVKRYGKSIFRIKLEIMKLVMIRSFREADGVIFHSDYAKKLVSKNVIPNRDIIIPVGIGDDFFQTPRNREIDKKKQIKILYVSSVFLYKHQWHVISGVEKLRNTSGLDLRLKLIGNGESRAMKKINNCLKILNYPDYIEFLEDLPTPFEGISEEYKKCDIFVFASSCENLPNNLLEAMAAGNPIASSNVSPMPDILGDAAEYFYPENPDSIADCISKIIDNPKNALKKAKKAQEISKEYTWKKCAEETFKFFEDVIDQHYQVS